MDRYRKNMKNFVHSALIAAAALLLGACSMEYSLDGSYAFDGMEREARIPSKPTGGNAGMKAEPPHPASPWNFSAAAR